MRNTTTRDEIVAMVRAHVLHHAAGGRRFPICLAVLAPASETQWWI